MSSVSSRARIETEALVIGYAMSRLDAAYLAARNLRSWQEAFAEASALTSLPANSFKNLRDEFDPVHANSRQGWHKRPLRPNRQRVLDELAGVSDDALAELAARILAHDSHATAEAVDSLSVVTGIAHNVAERLLTGRRAEEYFLSQCHEIVGVHREAILDMRNSARGFDFGVAGKERLAIEVKGIKRVRGDILFTDREWSEAAFRGSDYIAVIVGNLESDPRARVIVDPHSNLQAVCSYRTTIAACWTSRVMIDP